MSPVNPKVIVSSTLWIETTDKRLDIVAPKFCDLC